MRFGVLYSDGSINIMSNSRGEGHALSEATKEAKADKAQVIRVTGEIEVEAVTEERRPDPEPGAKHPGHC